MFCYYDIIGWDGSLTHRTPTNKVQVTQGKHVRSREASGIMHIGFFACFHGISQLFQENHIFSGLLVLKLLVLLIGRLEACSAIE